MIKYIITWGMGFSGVNFIPTMGFGIGSPPAPGVGGGVFLAGYYYMPAGGGMG